ncbi:hypothetical protein PP175_27935 (plasmid) [Aneurinibacillus sp. Ricciae_BoGa-3]|uniref:hypothetical protein n=1 Tax=Aneurinibacillus sp. Ricciae_BoGa-3 TaxID=3022697 RepID=UPI002341E1F6|nr:hypothetical protein [Aneurinibacillus sp. Ricciae_BoGa-3]WCK57023.1 hypothetical protein PP175_27935 [Aneurinibacillus sp. Ricciae_BoGa-3]
MDKEQARKKVEEFIAQRGYTYTVEDLIESYLKYYKQGYYVSFTTKECIKYLEQEFEILTNS